MTSDGLEDSRDAEEGASSGSVLDHAIADGEGSSSSFRMVSNTRVSDGSHERTRGAPVPAEGGPAPRLASRVRASSQAAPGPSL